MRVAAVSILLLVGCTQSKPEVTAQEQRQLAVDQIAAGCGATKGTWRMVDAEHLTIDSSARMSDTQFKCVLRKVEGSKLPVKLGIIGREFYPANAT